MSESVDNAAAITPSSSNCLSICQEPIIREKQPATKRGHETIRKSQSWCELNAPDFSEKPFKNSLNVATGGASGSQSPSELSLSTGVQVGKDLTGSSQCEMCANYEIKLQQLQDNERRLRQQLTASQSLSERCKNELITERAQREENESRFSSANGFLKTEVENLNDIFRQLELKIGENERFNKEKFCQYRKELDDAFAIRRRIEENFNALQLQYDRLLGKHRTEARAMNREPIDLPQNLDELNLFALQLREELIEAKLAKEHLEENLKSELMFMRDQLASEQNTKQQLEQTFMDEVNALRTDLAIAKSELVGMETLRKTLDDKNRLIEEHRITISDLESALATSKSEKVSCETSSREYRQRSLILQQELDNCEQVQRDFVRLSQSLQIELEKIRQADHEVRWQHEDDVLLCAGCKVAFTKHRRKLHCRHCGKIFCEGCLSKTVASGPQKRSVPVCDVCHTLLVRDTPPYFSSQVPSTVNTADNS